MNTPQAITQNLPAVTPSLMIPMDSSKWLLPTVNVAEMIPYLKPRPIISLKDDKSPPNWLLGLIDWRGVSIPIVSSTMLNEETSFIADSTSQIIILNNVGVSTDLPFYGVPTQGIPKLTRVSEEEIVQIQSDVTGAYDLMAVSVAGELAVIPDLEKLAREISSNSILDLE